MPGDRIRLVNKQLILNGQEVDEPYVYHKTEYIDSYRDNFPATRTCTWPSPRSDMLAQPRGRTARWWCRRATISPWATTAIPRWTAATGASCRADNIIGKPLIIYWSYDAPTEALAEPGVSIGHLLDMVTHFPTKTRWNRTFRLIHGYPLN